MGRIKPYSEAISNVRVDQLLERAVKGDVKATDELIARNKQLASRANRQLTYLEKAGYDRYAYDRAISYIDSEYKTLTNRFIGDVNYFKANPSKYTTITSGGEDVTYLKDVAWNIREMSTFLRAKSSTVAGNREIDREILDFFRNQSKKVTIDGKEVLQKVKIRKSEEKAFFDLLNSDAWEELKKTYYGSQDAIDMLIQVTNHNKKTTLDWEKLEEQLEKVRSGQLTMEVALEEFGYTI